MINVTIWNEFRHETNEPEIKKVYPDGIHGAIGEALSKDAEIKVTYATLDMPENGLDDAVLENTDVLIWWGHKAHGEVSDAVAEKVKKRVLDGMGFIPLHSSNSSKPFRLLMGQICKIHHTREDGETEYLHTILPEHPIAKGIPLTVTIPREECYSEPFGIPDPDEIVFIGWFSGGEVFRSGCVFRRGKGKVFYFQPGHEDCPVYLDETIGKILINAVKFCGNGDKK